MLSESSQKRFTTRTRQNLFSLGLCVLVIFCETSIAHGAAFKQPGHHRRAVSERKEVLERASQFEPMMAASGQRYGIDPRILWVIAYMETRFSPNRTSGKNAQGLMQFIPGTARRFGLADPYDAEASIDAAARYVQFLAARYNNSLDLILAAYNAGEGAVDCYLYGKSTTTKTGKVINRKGIKTGGVPPYSETVAYVNTGKVLYTDSALQNLTAMVSAPKVHVNKSESRSLYCAVTARPANTNITSTVSQAASAEHRSIFIR